MANAKVAGPNPEADSKTAPEKPAEKPADKPKTAKTSKGKPVEGTKVTIKVTTR